jgi:transcriptional antiterminator NusG
VVTETDTETETETETEVDTGFKWYVVNTYSGYEQQARKQLLKQAASKGIEAGFGSPIDDAILVPTEDVEQMVSGKPRVTKRKFFPGYMLVQMRWSPAIATFVRGLPKVIGFVGSRDKDPSREPRACSKAEMARLLGQITEGAEAPRRRLEVGEGDQIRVIDGPFQGFTGIVEEVLEERERLRVSFEILGRPTPVELEFKQVELDKG